MTNSTLQVALQNQTTSSTVYAYIIGQAVNKNNALFLLQADGQTPYYPASPSGTGAPLAVNCAISLGAPGATRTITIPQLAGGRVYFSVNNTLTFLLNPGPGLVEPSVTNGSDPNINTSFDFCEFTFNSSELYANISYVDFVCLPIALTVTNPSGGSQHVSGLPANGLATVAAQLQQQASADGAGWGKLLVNDAKGDLLRVLSPNTAITMNGSLFANYWQPYVNQVWTQYTNSTLSLDTQAQWGIVSGKVSGGLLNFGSAGSFSKPSAQDIFSNSSGPFAVGSNAELGNIAARVVAAFNRSTLLTDSSQPDGENVNTYYKNSITNHYARIVHALNVDGRGYAFPYDDVAPSGGKDQSGFVADGNPNLWTIAVGGANAHA
ncbi:hypothetical protein MMC25_005013 [Agyrium rufum]|nr:hypothetical protein [Agyrium rufum]